METSCRQKIFEEFEDMVTEFQNDTEKEKEISKILFSNAEEHFREFRSI
ncbi:MAG: hypothetical protein GW865_00660 [Candidatus Aenigmarchaeota archaeon]|nr:hypothetical protein [Candidatus Aenigmarchaeota archaeon]